MKYSIKFNDDIISEIKDRGNIKTWKVIKLISEYLKIECDYNKTSLKDLGIIESYVDIIDYTINFER